VSCLVYLLSALTRRLSSKESDSAAIDYNKLDYNVIHKEYTEKEIKKVRTRYRTTFLRYKAQEEELIRFEEEHDILTRWTPESAPYKEAEKLLAERSYRRAVDNLERLVVQRLFELTKLGMNGVGECVISSSKCISIIFQATSLERRSVKL